MDYIIFGASKFGTEVYNNIKAKYNIIAFCDNDANKWRKYICDLEIISPEKLKNFEGKIIIASMYHIEIVMQLTNYKILSFYVYSDLNSKEQKLIYYDYEEKDMSVKNNKITFIKDSNSGSNTFTLYRHLKNSKNLEVELVNEKYGKDKNYYFHILTSNVIVKSHEGSYIDGKINIQLWHGIPLKCLGFMNKVERVDCEKRHEIWNKSIIISYSQMYNVLMGACYGVSFKNFKITGVPRNDLLLKSNGRENLSRIFNIEDKKVFFYLPTYRESSYGEKNGSQNGYIFSNSDLKKLDEYLMENNMIIITKMHPFEEKSYMEYFNKNKFDNILFLTEENIVQQNIDLYEILNASDGLITDYSSVYFDYLLVNKPIIFFNKDLDNYSSSTGFLLEPYEHWTPGPKCFTTDQLITELIKINEEKDDYSSERIEMKKVFHKYTDENSCQRIEKVIEKLIQ